MNHWPFIFAAYAVVTIGIATLSVVSWRAMRRNEKDAEALRDRR